MYFYMSLQRRFRDVSLERRPGEHKKYVYIQMDPNVLFPYTDLSADFSLHTTEIILQFKPKLRHKIVFKMVLILSIHEAVILLDGNISLPFSQQRQQDNFYL